MYALVLIFVGVTRKAVLLVALRRILNTAVCFLPDPVPHNACREFTMLIRDSYMSSGRCCCHYCVGLGSFWGTQQE